MNEKTKLNEMDATMNGSFFKLECALKAYRDGLWIIHHNLKDDDFFAIHERFGDYYDKIGEFADDVIEMGITLGVQEPTLKDVVDAYGVVFPSGHLVNEIEALNFAKSWFDKLYAGFEGIRDQLPKCVESKFDDYENWLYKEARYLIPHRLGMIADRQ